MPRTENQAVWRGHSSQMKKKRDCISQMKRGKYNINCMHANVNSMLKLHYENAMLRICVWHTDNSKSTFRVPYQPRTILNDENRHTSEYEQDKIAL